MIEETVIALIERDYCVCQSQTATTCVLVVTARRCRKHGMLCVEWWAAFLSCSCMLSKETIDVYYIVATSM